MMDNLLNSLSKEDKENIQRQIKERYEEFIKNTNQTLNEREWKDLVWPSISKMNTSDNM